MRFPAKYSFVCRSRSVKTLGKGDLGLGKLPATFCQRQRGHSEARNVRSEGLSFQAEPACRLDMSGPPS